MADLSKSADLAGESADSPGEAADSPGEAAQRLHAIVYRLRRECPWDREQTHASLAPYCLEEAQELATALIAVGPAAANPAAVGPAVGNPAAGSPAADNPAGQATDEALVQDLVDELGDLLLQVYLNAAIGEQNGTFALTDVYAAVEQKMIRRHPHVFERTPGEPEMTEEQLAKQWARIKAEERQARSQTS